MPHYGTRGVQIFGAVAQHANALAASTAGSLAFGYNTIQNSTGVAAAIFTLPAPVPGVEVTVFAAAYSTAGTDSLTVAAPTGVKISDGTTPTEDSIAFDAAGQYVRLAAISDSLYLVVGSSTGLTLST